MVYINHRGSNNKSESEHAASRNKDFQQWEKHRNTVRYNAQTTRNGKMEYLCYGCVHVDYMSLHAFGACTLCLCGCLYCKMHLLCSFCVRVCITQCGQLFRRFNSWACLHLPAICECLWSAALTEWTLPHDGCSFLISGLTWFADIIHINRPDHFRAVSVNKTDPKPWPTWKKCV